MSATIRAAVAGDVGAIADIYTSIVEDTYISFETTPPSEDEIASQIWDTLERFPQIICEYDG